ncbi:MAG: hypothetical protein GX285_08425 [Clostridiales bacterium]|nr:hypothetical protein [Clostridiales bacterium]
MKRGYYQFLFLLVGVLLLVAGIYRQEAYEVMIKAINICLECIGIG